jgi:hypothetical protein
VTSSFVFPLLVGNLFAQQTMPPPKPASDVHIVQIRLGAYAGFSSDGYSAMETTIQSKSIRSVQRAPDKKKYPDLRTKRKITKEDWDELRHAIDPAGLFCSSRSDWITRKRGRSSGVD